MAGGGDWSQVTRLERVRVSPLLILPGEGASGDRPSATVNETLELLRSPWLAPRSTAPLVSSPWFLAPVSSHSP